MFLASRADRDRFRWGQESNLRLEKGEVQPLTAKQQTSDSGEFLLPMLPRGPISFFQ